eukprot:Colp12_sorted_trinity150504_noHs@34497
MAKTTVVNVKVAHIRPTYSNLKEWMEKPEHAYIGRAGIVFVEGKRFPPHASVFANPFKIGKDGTRKGVMIKYEKYIRDRLRTDPGLKEQLKALRGKKLGCWCHPEPCHGDVLVKLIEENTKKIPDKKIKDLKKMKEP